jgi:hypothetical protein
MIKKITKNDIPKNGGKARARTTSSIPTSLLSHIPY